MTTTDRPRSKRQRAQDIIERVGKVPGWQVVKTHAGYELVSPRLDAVSLHAVPGDWNFDQEVWRALDGAGFLEDELGAAKAAVAKESAEAAAAAVKEKAKAQAAARKAAEDAARRAKLIKAAGPYLVDAEDIEWDWFTRPHPAPWVRWANINPALATHLLDTINTHNRPMYDKTVDEYRDKIRQGLWTLTHQGMAVDRDGVLQDGQHRLKAIKLEGADNPGLVVPVPFFVGMPPENFKHVDEGRNRRAQDLLGRDGVGYSALVAGATRLVIAYDNKQPRKTVRGRVANATIYERFNDDGAELREAARYAANHYKKLYVGPSPLAAAHYLLRKKNGPDNPFVKAFLEGLARGYKPDRRLLNVLDPREVIRNQFQNLRMQRKRTDGLSTLCLIILAWNNVVSGREPRNIAFTDKSEIPEVLLCLPGQTAWPSALQGEIPREQVAQAADKLDGAA